MRHLITIAFILSFLTSQGQDITRCEIVREFESPYRPPTILLFKDNTRLDSTVADFRGEFIYRLLDPGNYKLIFCARQQDTLTIDNIVAEQNQILLLRIKVKGYCLYDYPSNYVPKCPENQSDKIIPIFYGLIGHVVSKGDQKKEPETKEPDEYSGGCVTTGCDPQYYCTVHKIKF